MPEVENNTTEETVDVDSSILLSVKKVIGLTPDDTSFDTDIIMHINSVGELLLFIIYSIPTIFYSKYRSYKRNYLYFQIISIES